MPATTAGHPSADVLADFAWASSTPRQPRPFTTTWLAAPTAELWSKRHQATR